MDKQQTEALRFKMKFSKSVFGICIAIFLLCFAGGFAAIWQIVKFGVNGPWEILQYPFLIAVCLFCIISAAIFLARSQYVIKDGKLITWLGFIKSTAQIKNVTSILLNSDTKKLSVYFGEQCSQIAISPQENEKFARALLEVNPDIDYGFTLAEAPQKDKKDKK